MLKNKKVSVSVPESLFFVPDEYLSKFLEFELSMLVSNLMQSDTYEKISDYWQYFNGDLDGKA